jgi:hypothetical protein
MNDVRDEAKQVAKQAAKDATWRWVRTHPRQTAKAAAVVARHPRRASQVVSEAQTLREAAPDPRFQRFGRHLGGMRDARRSDLTGTIFWTETAAMAFAALRSYTDARERRARRARRRRVMIAVTAAAALAGVVVYRRSAATPSASEHGVTPVGSEAGAGDQLGADLVQR